MGRGDQISLREWINVALDAINTSNESLSAVGADPRTLALSADDFLTSALKVAKSLADQICQAQDDRCLGENNEGKTHPHPHSQTELPAPCSSWSDKIFVHLSSTSTTSSDQSSYDPSTDENRGRGLLSPIPFSHDDEPTARSEELRDMLKSVIGDVSLLEKEDNDEDNAKVAEEAFKSHYLQVASAKLIPDNSNSNGSSSNDKSKKGANEKQIHALGLVFYEIFSGGEKPADSSSTVSDTESDYSKGREPELLLSVNDKTEIIDVASNLNLLDDDAPDEILGFSTGKHKSDLQDHQISKKNQPTHTMCLVSAEILKSRGLPWSLCNLIANMIDCANGDLSGDETYQHMVDVSGDLQRMLDKVGAL